VDELIAVATHACFDGAYRLGWFVDVAWLLRRADWDTVRDRCVATGTALPVQVIVDRAVRALGIPAPGPALVDGTWRRALGAISALRPAERTFRQAGRGGVAFRATRARSAPSFAALARLGMNEAVLPALTDRNHRWRQSRTGRD
jgi:hypothetical protein